MLQAERLSKTFGGQGGKQVLNELDLVIEPGECIAVVGPKGTGKSTLLNVLGGLIRSDSGHVRIDGIELERLSDAELTHLRRSRIGFIFQSFHLLPHLSAGLNIALPLQLDGMPRADALKRARELMAAIALEHAMESLPGELTPAEAQRVAVARALAHRPAVILADEPFNGADPAQGANLLEFLKLEIKALGACAMVMSSEVTVARHADRALTLDRGQLKAWQP